jgi:hypothetical protein
VSFSWSHINGASYWVSRNGVSATPNPMTSAVYPATLNFAESAPFYHNMNYLYTVTAQYQNGGCGISRVSFAGVRPWVALTSSSVSSNPRSVTVAWRLPDELFVCGQSGPFSYCTLSGPGRDFTGFLVTGPGLPASGYQIWGCTGAPYTPLYLTDPPINYPPFTTKAPFREECYGNNTRPEWRSRSRFHGQPHLDRPFLTGTPRMDGWPM